MPDQDKKIIKHDPNAEYCIEFDNVYFNYRSKDNVIFKNPLNFELRQTNISLLFGKSGEGKTTILDLISGVIKPIEGQIKWYGRGHQPDQTDITFGYISQEFSVFNGTVRQNITLGERDDLVSNEWLDACIEAVSLTDLIASLPEGLDTPLGERGLSLSGGQRQRLVIARELYKKPDILLMDEATSALDNATEKLVRHSIQKMHGKVTVILVAHRVQTLEYVDQIFVLNKGQIIETGSYQDFRNNDDTYFNQIFPKMQSDKKRMSHKAGVDMSKNNYHACILASGIGSRFKSSTPKQFKLLNGKPIYLYTLETAIASNIFDYIEVKVQKQHAERVQNEINSLINNLIVRL